MLNEQSRSEQEVIIPSTKAPAVRRRRLRRAHRPSHPTTRTPQTLVHLILLQVLDALPRARNGRTRLRAAAPKRHAPQIVERARALRRRGGRGNCYVGDRSASRVL